MTMNRGLFRWASGLGVLLVAGSIQAGKAAAPVDRWTARTPDEMLDLAIRRAERGGDGAMAGLALAYSLADRAAAGRARKGLREPQLAPTMTSRPKPDGWRPSSIRIRRRLCPAWFAAGRRSVRFKTPAAASPDTRVPKRPARSGAIPLHRMRGAPTRSAGARFRAKWSRREAFHSISWCIRAKRAARTSPPRSPCATKRRFVLSVAASGLVRLLWDGVDAGKSEEDHLGLVFDRIAAKIEPTVGDHVLGVKVCSGAPNDEGRVRVRATDASGKPVELATSADIRLKLAPAKPTITPVATPLGSGGRGRKESDRRAGDGRSGGAERSARPTISVPREHRGFSTRSPTRKTTSPDTLAMAGWISRSARRAVDG